MRINLLDGLTDVDGNSHALDFFLIVGAMILMCMAMLVWSIFICSFLRRRGFVPASALFNWSPHIDYFRARKIAKKEGHIPWFIKLFEIMFGAALIMAITFCVRIIIDFG
jgi:hypothetical protein